MKYRPEIDGLRALAVLPVILFHARIQTFSGGFVGVDVFFVISGYLITSIIQSDLAKGQFSIVNFYERRARRILPALFLVVACCLPAAWFWLWPNDMKAFSESVASVAVFSSNFLFLHQSGYFDTAEVKPLLHTWSLAVEEQFYVLFPLLLFLAWRYARKWLVPLIIAVALASFLLADWGSTSRPAATFFLLPTRAWELSLGALVAFHLAKTPGRSGGRIGAEFLSAAGLALIGVAVFAFDERTPFPGRYALLPACGTALIILFGSPRTLVGRLLGAKPLVAVGLVSYSAYLWHQPILSFARELGDEPLRRAALVALMGLSLVLAYLSWKYVESPFRSRSQFSRRQVFAFAGIGSVIFLALGLVGHATNGFEARLTPEQRTLLSYIAYDAESNYWRGNCFLMPEQSVEDFKEDCSVSSTGGDLIWGDSHAAALTYGFRVFSKRVVQYAGTGCPPLFDTTRAKRPHCKEFNDYIRSEISRIKPDRVFMHANWSLYKTEASRESVERTIRIVRELSPTSQIVVIGSVPHWYRQLPKIILRKRSGLDDQYYLGNSGVDELKRNDEFLRAVSTSSNVDFVSPIEAMCGTSGCLATIRYEGVVMPTTWDESHLTAGASVFLARRILERRLAR